MSLTFNLGWAGIAEQVLYGRGFYTRGEGAIRFPIQIYVVYHRVERKWGIRAGLFTAVKYGISLIPSSRLFIRRRDILRQHFATTRNALSFLLHPGPAARLKRQRQRVQRKLIDSLGRYDADAL